MNLGREVGQFLRIPFHRLKGGAEIMTVMLVFMGVVAFYFVFMWSYLYNLKHDAINAVKAATFAMAQCIDPYSLANYGDVQTLPDNQECEGGRIAEEVFARNASFDITTHNPTNQLFYSGPFVYEYELFGSGGGTTSDGIQISGAAVYGKVTIPMTLKIPLIGEVSPQMKAYAIVYLPIYNSDSQAISDCGSGAPDVNCGGWQKGYGWQYK